jgi:hypothetical protein
MCQSLNDLEKCFFHCRLFDCVALDAQFSPIAEENAPRSPNPFRA